MTGLGLLVSFLAFACMTVGALIDLTAPAGQSVGPYKSPLGILGIVLIIISIGMLFIGKG